jgi:hypothetical protein
MADQFLTSAKSASNPGVKRIFMNASIEFNTSLIRTYRIVLITCVVITLILIPIALITTSWVCGTLALGFSFLAERSQKTLQTYREQLKEALSYRESTNDAN